MTKKARIFPKLILAIAVQLVLFMLAGLIYLRSGSKAQTPEIILFILTLIVSCFIYAVIVIVRTSSRIKTVGDGLQKLSSGSIPSDIKFSGNDEVSSISDDLNALTRNLKAKADFVNQISSANLSAEYALLNEGDTLGKSLHTIKASLIRIKSEEEQRKWVTDALSKFVEILRANNGLKELSNDVIINLVQILHANQGAVFIKMKDEHEEEYLDMQACYAYQRAKHFTKRVAIGEGIIGQVFLEQETLYLKDIPDNFIRITSGLGDANPTYILILPLKMNGVVVGIIELASFQEFARHEIEFAEKICESIAHTITSFQIAEHTKTLLQEAEERAEQMRSQEEELRQNQEELSATQEEISRKYNALFVQLKDLNYQSKFDQLLSITFTKKRSVEYYFDIIRNQIITFSENKTIIEATSNFIKAFYKLESKISAGMLYQMKQHVIKYYESEFIPRLNDNTSQTQSAAHYIPMDDRSSILQSLYIAANKYPTGKKSLLDDAKDGSEYSQVHAAYHPMIRSYLEKFDYYDIFILDSTTGDLVYSVFKEIDFATNLLTGLYSNTNFGRVVREAIETKDKDFVRLIDFELYDPSYRAPASFIARAVYDGDIKIGIVVFQMPIHKINQILTGDNHWREDGLGQSGETFIVGNDYRLRSITRGLIENSDQYLALLREQGYDEDVIRQIGKTGTNILLERVKLDSASKALKGNSGKQLERNQLGIESLYAFTPLHIPDVNWVILSSLKEEEASERIESLRNI